MRAQLYATWSHVSTSDMSDHTSRRAYVGQHERGAMNDADLLRAAGLEVDRGWSEVARLYRKFLVSGSNEVTKGRTLLQLAVPARDWRAREGSPGSRSSNYQLVVFSACGWKCSKRQ